MLLPLFKSLADETRLRLLHLLSRGELTVQDLTVILAMGQSRISRHLKILHDAGLLAVKRQGTWSYYRAEPANPWLARFWELLVPQLHQLPSASADLLEMSRHYDRQRAADRAFFDRHARQWDLLKQTVLPLVPYREEFLERVGSGELLVEIGIGTGSLIPELAARWVRVIGIDHTPAMLEEAAKRLANETTDRVELRLGEMTALPVADARAETVVMNMVLHHASQPLEVLSEIFRILRPGGRLALADLLRHGHDWTREVLADVWLGFDEEELATWLHRVGFREIDICRLPADGTLNGVLLMAAGKPIQDRKGDENQ